MTIHSEHPFLPPEGERSVVRRLRGRWPGGVSVVTTGTGRSRVGLTVSSLLVVDGDPGVVLVMLDPLADLADALGPDVPCVVNVLASPHRDLAEAFAGVTPAPGGPFTLGEWHDGGHGPELVDAAATVRCRVATVADHETGWSVRHELTVEDVSLTDVAVLRHERGAYH
ncbi:flavin reductase family protein [Aeromicrobium sp. Leaf350]|uniref:flavin reductase family protein n=1 Tax=Aeromicrobium sp. Leaf350 TaxID=2876565 RepID=UPI001E4374A7|nr:flavin reductase family protein [Aeromicrobium sp. Leaf350]